jgi:hypothetical protein
VSAGDLEVASIVVRAALGVVAGGCDQGGATVALLGAKNKDYDGQHNAAKSLRKCSGANRRQVAAAF